MKPDQSADAASVNLLAAFTKLPPGQFPRHLEEGPGVSFSYAGLSHNEVLSRLKVTSDRFDDSDPDHPTRRVQLTDTTIGLDVTLEYVYYPEHAAVVYGASLKNNGHGVIEHVGALRSYDLVFEPLQSLGNPTVHTLGGGVTHMLYPPMAYRLQESYIAGPNVLTIDSGPSGRSSNKDLPFFYIEDGERTSGLFGGIEWSGLWHFDFIRKDEPHQIHYGQLGPNKSLSIQGGMDEADLNLLPGETVHIPRVLLGFYEGPIEAGRNRLRRFLSDWTPVLSDGRRMPFIQAVPGGYICPPSLTTDAQCRAHAEANAEIGAEYYVIECWFQDLPELPEAWGATGSSRGTWHPDRERFPDMKALADFVRSKGLRFGLWTDMEVAHVSSEVARQHPEWILYLPGDRGAAPSPNGLFNLAIPAAQDWAIAVYDRLISEYGVEWIFYDNNIDPRPYWDANEPAHRLGRLQHDYIRGVWRVWDEVRRRHPNVVLENCSSGGRRIDLGTLGRAHCNFTSDQFRYGDAVRYQFSGANTVLPGHLMINGLCRGWDDYPDEAFHQHFAGLFNITEGVEKWSPDLKARAKKHFDVYKSVRHLLAGDFYPLFPQPQSLREWDGWQFHDPATGEGFALAFRVQSDREEASPRLRGLDTGRTYSVVDPYIGTTSVVDGRSLIYEGLPFSLQKSGSRLLHYRPI